MKMLKKTIAVALTFAMVLVLFAGVSAFADSGIAIQVAESGENEVVATVSLTGATDLMVIDFIVSAPEGFTYKSHTNLTGLPSEINNEAAGHFIWDTTGDAVSLSAGPIATITYSMDPALAAGDYVFTVTVDQATADSDTEEPIAGLEGASASATYTVVDPATPTADPAAGEVDKGTEVKFSCETEGAEIYYSTDGGKTWTKGDSFTVDEDVTIQVKAVKGTRESAIATFAYTVKVEAPVETQPVETQPVDTPAPTEKPAEPTPAPTEKPAEPTPAPTEKPAETTPAPTEKPAEPTAAPTQKPVNPNNPTTGDESHLVLYVMIMVATLALGAVTFVVIRKGNKA